MNIDLTIDLKETSVIIKDFIKTYVNNSGCKGVVIGLSGGVDSTVTAILCRDVLGKKNVKCLFLPDDTTPENLNRQKYPSHSRDPAERGFYAKGSGCLARNLEPVNKQLLKLEQE